MIDTILDWFYQNKDNIAWVLITVGGIFNIAGFVAKLGCLSFSIGGILIVIGIVLLSISSPQPLAFMG